MTHLPPHDSATAAREPGAIERARRSLGDPRLGEGPPPSMVEWLRASLTRRFVLIALALVVCGSIHASGLVVIPPVAFALLSAWLVIAGALFVWLRDRSASGLGWRVHMGAQLMDIVGTLLVTHELGATLWYAPLALAITITVGGQTLPRANAIVLAALASAGYALTVFAEINGWWPARGPFVHSTLPGASEATAAIVIVSVVLFAMAVIQRGFYRHVTAIETKHNRLLDTALDIICTLDRSGRFVSANAAVEEQLGWKRDEMIGQHFQKYVIASDHAVAMERFESIARGATVSLDVHVIAGNGATRLLSTIGAPILDEDGAVIAVLGIGRDVTEERARAGQLAESERKLRLLVESVNETVFTLDRNLRFTAIYGRWAPDAPSARREVVGKTPHELLGDQSGNAFLQPMQRALAGETVEIEQALSFGKGARHFRLSFTPLRDDDGGIVGVTGVAFDVTEQRRAEGELDGLRARLEESRRNEAIGRLVSGVAHELNNPLAAILTFTEQLRADATDPADVVALETIHSQAMRSRAIVGDLLAYVRPETQRPRAAARVADILAASSQSLRPHLALLGVTLECDLPGEDVWIDADTAGIDQVITNLVLNAAYAAGRDGYVILRGNFAGDDVSIVVEDTGAGIAASAMPHLFEPFYTTKPVGQGTGLGLSVARAIVQQHGGDIRAENRSANEGGGARFVVRVPRLAHPAAGAGPSPRTALAEPRIAPPAAASPSNDGAVPRILIVDDEEPIRLSLQRFFSRRGWEVTGVGDGNAALRELRTAGEHGFTMVLCDLRMPGMGGTELHARLAEELPGVLTRLVITSGDTVSAEAAALLRNTTCRVLEKPFELKTLGAIADEMLASQRNAA